MDPSALHHPAEVAPRRAPGHAGAAGWRRWMPGRDALLAWVAAVAAVTVCIDFAAHF